MKTVLLSMTLLVSLVFLATGSPAEGPRWVVFDADYPHDYIDVSSITYPQENIVRFWERAGERHEEEGKIVYPQYSLLEMNCRLKTSRSLRWDMALEDQDTVPGIEARLRFIESWTKALGYDPTSLEREPTPWKSVEPNKHSYVRLDFVCKGVSKK